MNCAVKMDVLSRVACDELLSYMVIRILVLLLDHMLVIKIEVRVES